METPKLVDIEQQTDGWVKKYVLKYEMPEGTMHDYNCATRRPVDEFRAGLERNARVSRAVMDGLQAPDEPFTPDAVCIVAKTPRDTLVMIREFRYPLNSWCVAFPAGLIDEGEDFATSATRELREETGYTFVPGSAVRALPQPGYSSTGLTDETVQVVFVEAEKTCAPAREGNELIEVFELPIADARKFLDDNELPIGTRAQLILELFALQA